MCSPKLDVGVSEPVRVLKSEECSTRLAVGANEPVRVLKTELVFPLLAVRLRELERFLAKLLISVPVIDNEPVRVLASVRCSVMLDVEPSELLTVLPMPLA